MLKLMLPLAFERQTDGAWKCIYEMWNDNPLPETPAKEQPD
jgi:ketosteroid isomerase-like protein